MISHENEGMKNLPIEAAGMYFSLGLLYYNITVTA
jgi:hypothetical protein